MVISGSEGFRSVGAEAFLGFELTGVGFTILEEAHREKVKYVPKHLVLNY